jgi:C-terminal processing protease CtpA/Prc
MVVNSTDSKYENGTVLAELKEKSAKEYFLLYNSSNKLAFATIKPKDGELISGFFKNGKEVVNKTNYNFESKLLNENTLYFNIPSFSWEAKPMVDSLFAAQKENLSKTSSLIIDLRNNGGGSDDVYGVISPYLYTQPIKGIGVDIWASNDNIRGWELMLQDSNLPSDNKAEYQKMVDKLKLKINQNVNIIEDNIDSSYTMLLFPKNVVILINEGCASSTEQFLLEAIQSKKVTLMGQNTSGTLDYSNLRESDFCDMPYRLWSPTTRSRRIDIGAGIDGIGIKPNIYLTEKQDWIEEALNFLNTKLKNNR